MKSADNPQKNTRQYALNLTLAGIAGLAGLITLVIVFVAMFAGIWLDNKFGTNHNFTIGLILGSVPVTLIIMFYFVRSATSKIKPSIPKKPLEEEDNSGKIP
jgi:MFS-type transporter involved in bile tolerance (Atg22 family)